MSSNFEFLREAMPKAYYCFYRAEQALLTHPLVGVMYIHKGVRTVNRVLMIAIEYPGNLEDWIDSDKKYKTAFLSSDSLNILIKDSIYWTTEGNTFLVNQSNWEGMVKLFLSNFFVSLKKTLGHIEYVQGQKLLKDGSLIEEIEFDASIKRAVNADFLREDEALFEFWASAYLLFMEKEKLAQEKPAFLKAFEEEDLAFFVKESKAFSAVYLNEKVEVGSLAYFESVLWDLYEFLGQVVLPRAKLNMLFFSDVYSLKEVDLDFEESPSWIFLTGENGYGKTLVLQAIAAALYGEDEATYEFLKEGAVNAGILYLVLSYSFLRLAAITLSTNIDSPHRNVIAYGSSRLVPRQVVKQAGEYNMVRSLFESDAPLRDIEDEYINWFARKEIHPRSKARYQQVKALFEEVVPDLELEIDEENFDRLYYRFKGDWAETTERLPFNRLSAGYRNILAILGDLVLNLYELQPTVTDIKALGGIVLIDELELHLHPKWQHKLPKLLSDAFPNVQFIASTHSPIPLLGAPEGAVFLKVDRDQERGIFVERLEGLEKEIEDLLPNTVLSSPLFGLKDLRSIKHKEENPVKVEDDYAEIERKAALEDALNKKLAEFDFSEDLKKEQDEKGE